MKFNFKKARLALATGVASLGLVAPVVLGGATAVSANARPAHANVSRVAAKASDAQYEKSHTKRGLLGSAHRVSVKKTAKKAKANTKRANHKRRTAKHLRKHARHVARKNRNVRRNIKRNRNHKGTKRLTAQQLLEKRLQNESKKLTKTYNSLYAKASQLDHQANMMSAKTRVLDGRLNRLHVYFNGKNQLVRMPRGAFFNRNGQLIKPRRTAKHVARKHGRRNVRHNHGRKTHATKRNRVAHRSTGKAVSVHKHARHAKRGNKLNMNQINKDVMAKVSQQVAARR